MTHTVEDTLEILAGLGPRLVNIRLDYNEKTLIKSIGRQVSNGLALTDRQFELVLKKIEKYRGNLEKNGINVDDVLQNKKLRLPLRQIDRSKRIFIATGKDNVRVISIKMVKNKDFFEIWDKFQGAVIGPINERGYLKEIPLNEMNVIAIMTHFANKDFDIDQEILDIHQKIEKIFEDPTKFVPYLDIEDRRIVVKNANRRCQEYIDKNILEKYKDNTLAYLDKVKNCGIFHKKTEVIEKISEITDDELSKEILIQTTTRFRLPPEKYSPKEILKIVNSLDQWPILVLVDDSQQTKEQVVSFYEAAREYVDNSEITVFFRIDSGQNSAQEFNQFVKENYLNNYIGPHTKVVFIAKNKIPKPLLRADWRPYTAIMLGSHDYGKTAAFLDDFPTVYYYNSSVSLRNSKIKGARPIVQL